MPSLYSLENPVFKSFVVAGGILGAKLVANSLWTVTHRLTREVYPMPEDVKCFGGSDANNQDPVIERIRRMHLHDLENYTPFFILALLYISVDPDPKEADILFKSFVGVRLAHTLTFAGLSHQPGRVVTATGAWGVNLFLAYRVLTKVLKS